MKSISIPRAIVGFLTVFALAAITLAIPFAAKAADAPAASPTAAPGVRGLVTAVSSTSITVHNKKANTDTTFTVSPTTKVKLDKADSTVSAITVGMHANILSADGKAADTIEAHTGTGHTKAP